MVQIQAVNAFDDFDESLANLPQGILIEVPMPKWDARSIALKHHIVWVAGCLWSTSIPIEIRPADVFRSVKICKETLTDHTLRP